MVDNYQTQAIKNTIQNIIYARQLKADKHDKLIKFKQCNQIQQNPKNNVISKTNIPENFIM